MPQAQAKAGMNQVSGIFTPFARNSNFLGWICWLIGFHMALIASWSFLTELGMSPLAASNLIFWPLAN